MEFIRAFGGVFSLLIVVSLGYFLAARGWFAPPVVKLLPRLVTNVSLPPFLACTIISSCERGNLLHMLYGAGLPLLLISLLFVMAYMLGKVINVEKRHFGLFCACVSNPNTIFIGIPINQALFGASALPYVLLYYFASTFFFWTVGNYFISRDQRGDGGEQPFMPRGGFQWQKIISAPFFGFIAGVAFVCLDIGIPDFIFRAAVMVGELTTPLALIFIGITLQSIDLKHLRLSSDMWIALGCRLLLSPCMMWLLVPWFGLPELMGKVFIIQSSLPVLMQVAILSAYYNTDPEFGSIMVSISTVCCAITVPLWMGLT